MTMWTRSAPVLAAAAFLIVIPPLLSAYPLTLVTQALIYAIFAMSLDLLLGYTGLASLGHAAYFAAGAYVVAILSTSHHVSLWLCLPLAALGAGLVAALFGLLAIRALGVYFLMITLALGMVVWGLAFRWVSLTQGDNGISGIPRPAGAGVSFAGPVAFYYLVLAAAGLSTAFLWVTVRSPFGLSLRGIRESERRMRALGYPVWLHKYLAFILAGSIAGLAGGLFACYNGFVSPADAQLVTSVEAVLMVALGGPGTLFGPALGAGLIVFLKHFVSVYTNRWLLILGAVYIGVILAAPGGIMGLAGALRRKPPTSGTSSSTKRR